MILQEIIDDIHVLTDDVRVYERKYGILSETFYEIYSSGTEPENDDWVLDWSDWAGAYKILLRRQILLQNLPEMQKKYCSRPVLSDAEKHLLIFQNNTKRSYSKNMIIADTDF